MTAVARARSVSGDGSKAGLSMLAGLAGLGALWWVGGALLRLNPDLVNFSQLAPGPTLAAFWKILGNGYLFEAALASLQRIAGGLAWAVAIGVPAGILIGRVPSVARVTHAPFQFLRMVSPLSWMPIAILIFDTWDGAIIFLLAAAAVWPILFSTAHGLARMDPQWFKVVRNLGASSWYVLVDVIAPAITQDVLTGFRLALGVAWIILVPAEYLGVTSGLGYAINDARDTLEYDRLAAIVLAIGIIGFALDSVCVWLIRRLAWRIGD